MENKQALWIAFGDIHEQTGQLDLLGDLASARGAILTGDLIAKGGLPAARDVVAAVRRKTPGLWAQIGNMDTPAVDQYLTDEGVNIHARAVVLDPDFPDVLLLGVGASTPTPFNTPSEVSDEQIGRWLDQALEAARAMAVPRARLVLVAHDPPFDTAADRLSSGQHVGSKAVRCFIERVQPAVCLTGHIHESPGVDNLGQTTIINPGPLFMGGYVRLTIRPNLLDAELVA